MTPTPRVGQVYERDGRRRQIVRLVDFDNQDTTADQNHYVIWVSPDRPHKQKKCWCSTWMEWVQSATLVSQ